MPGAVQQQAEGVEQAVDEVMTEYDDSWAIGGTCRQEFWTSPGDGGFKVGFEFCVFVL